MFDDLSQFLQKAQALPPDKRTVAMTMFVFWSLAQCVYYIMLGIVVIVLGRRLINATLTAWRENRREHS